MSSGSSRFSMPTSFGNSPHWSQHVAEAASKASGNPFVANFLSSMQQQHHHHPTEQQQQNAAFAKSCEQTKPNLALLNSMASFYSPIMMINKFINSSMSNKHEPKAKNVNEQDVYENGSFSLTSSESEGHHNLRTSLSSNSDDMNQMETNSNHNEDYEDEEDDEDFEREKSVAEAQARHAALVNMLLMMKSQSQQLQQRASNDSSSSFMEHSSNTSNNLSPTAFSSSSPSSTASSSSSCCSSVPSSAGSNTAGHVFFRSASSKSTDANNNDLSRKSDASVAKRASCDKKINFAIVSTLVDWKRSLKFSVVLLFLFKRTFFRLFFFENSQLSILSCNIFCFIGF